MESANELEAAMRELHAALEALTDDDVAKWSARERATYSRLRENVRAALAEYDAD